MIELLAPAGSMEALKTAIASGANAIYLAGKNFGARAFANNFDKEEIKQAVEYAHLRGVRINVTVNTLIDEKEIKDLKEYILFLAEIKVDAILVQDMGVAHLVRQLAPNLPLHASTQMTVNTLAGVQALEELAFTRVVLAREVSLEDIRHICKYAKAEIEIFAHGALCVCYSGQCLMSSMIGGRSGNRGRCAQPCRLPYTLENAAGKTVLQDAGAFLLSPKDMNTLELVPELIEAGVASLKLEGRMKKPEYVAIVVSTYREKIDNYYDNKQDRKDLGHNLQETFNREFTTAYLEEQQGKYMMAADKPNNKGKKIGEVVLGQKRKGLAVRLTESLNLGDILSIDKETITVDENILAQVKGKFLHTKLPTTTKLGTEVYRVYNGQLMAEVKDVVQKPEEFRKFPLSFIIYAKEGEKFALTGMDGEHHCTLNSDFTVVKALKRNSDEAYFHKQLNRLGGTIYYLDQLNLEIDEGIMVPASVINELRRQVVDNLLAQRLANYKGFTIPAVEPLDRDNKVDFSAVSTKLTVAVDDFSKLEAAVNNGAEIIIYGGDTFNHRVITPGEVAQVCQYGKEKNVAIYLGSPRIMRDSEVEKFAQFIKDVADLPLAGIYLHSLAQMYIVRKYTKLNIWADYSFNIWNSHCLEFLKSYGCYGATLSQELTMAKDKELQKRKILPLECIVHGRTELMVSEYCVLGSFLGNLHQGKCSMPCVKDKYYLRDRKNQLIPLGTDANCHMHILNGKILNMLTHLPEFTKEKFARVRIDGRSFSPEELGNMVKIYKEVLEQGKNHPVFANNNLAAYEIDITRGHYFRGVE